MSPAGHEEPLTRDVQEDLKSLKDSNSRPRIRCLLYGNKVLQHYGQTENNRRNTSMVFGKTSLMYRAGIREGKGINENQINSNLDP